MIDDTEIKVSNESDPDFVPEQKLEIKTIHIVKITVGEVQVTLSRKQAKDLHRILGSLLQ